MIIFKNKFLVKLIASLCIFLTLLNFAPSAKVYATGEIWGGVLISPIIELVVAIGDRNNEFITKCNTKFGNNKNQFIN